MRFLAFLLILCSATLGLAQKVGDTITIRTFNYSQTYGINQWSPGIRDSVIDFSVLPNVQFEKVLMTYNMRCKDAKVSTGSNRDRGCGEWDASCNTYFHDSSDIDSVAYSHPNYVISGFGGTSFNYTSQPVYNYYQYNLRDVKVDNINSETEYDLFSGNAEVSKAINGSEKSGKVQVLYTKTELAAAGFSAGDIDGLKLNAVADGKVNFFRVRMKEVTADSLDIKSIDQDGLKQVYFGNYAFVKGENRVQFIRPFTWSGDDHLLVEFCFTNTTATSQIELEGSSAKSGQVVVANNNHSVNLSANAHFDIPASSLSTISEEVTVSFWAFGNANAMPTNTTIINGLGANGERDLNIHLPWGNGQVYWDCGADGDGYDRINKSASTMDLGGQWNHWAFTKNATSGDMKIYLNGKLWHSGVGKTKSIDLSNLVLGKSSSYAQNYKGSVDELRVWDKALTENEIADWMNISIDASHPNYKHLVAYYPMDEGANTEMYNKKDAQDTAKGTSTLSWQFNRGIELNRFFSYAAVRPNISLVQGDYDTSVVVSTVLDSLPMSPRSVLGYSIKENKGQLLNDEVVQVSSEILWRAVSQPVYQGTTTTVLRRIPVTEEGTYEVKDLKYYRRWPAKYEIMSFVTPYGVNLDLGKNGKTWTFDVTDYLPIFTGQKRMTVERGGQWMEDMDIRFHFIVGTPVREVLDIQQVWKTDSRGYAAINNDTYFAPRQIQLDGSAKYYVIRSTITGHGQEGEFIPRNHHLSVNGTRRFTWEVWKECAENPVYPQGGTWVYDRAGWCPGAPTDLQLSDITEYAAGQRSVELDYDVDVASGSSNYIVNHQLVSYGAINHAVDARLLEVKNPSKRVEFARFNSNCHKPVVVIQNTGSTEMTSATIKYWINDAKTPLTYNWTGKLAFLETVEVGLPPRAELWEQANSTGNVFHAEITEVNGAADEYAPNNVYHSAFDLTEVIPRNFIIQLRTNSQPAETNYELIDFSGKTIFRKDNLAVGTLYRDTFEVGLGCYTLLVNDLDDDGLSWWANNDGSGAIEIRDVNGKLIKTFNPDFGDNIRFNFTIDYPLSYEELHPAKGIQLYPNPAESRVRVSYEGNTTQPLLQVMDFNGRVVYEQHMEAPDRSFDVEVPLEELSDGFYLVKITDGDAVHTSKFIKK